MYISRYIHKQCDTLMPWIQLYIDVNISDYYCRMIDNTLETHTAAASAANADVADVIVDWSMCS